MTHNIDLFQVFNQEMKAVDSWFFPFMKIVRDNIVNINSNYERKWKNIYYYNTVWLKVSYSMQYILIYALTILTKKEHVLLFNSNKNCFPVKEYAIAWKALVPSQHSIFNTNEAR